jgi:hypothetical protein
MAIAFAGVTSSKNPYLSKLGEGVINLELFIGLTTCDNTWPRDFS